MLCRKDRDVLLVELYASSSVSTPEGEFKQGPATVLFSAVWGLLASGLVGLVVKASTSRAEGPGFESR